jgi:hypothetical protein
MNKLIIRTEVGKNVVDRMYFVEDAHTLYVRTTNLQVAEDLFKQLKLEYQEELKNASKI